MANRVSCNGQVFEIAALAAPWRLALATDWLMRTPSVLTRRAWLRCLTVTLALSQLAGPATAQMLPNPAQPPTVIGDVDTAGPVRLRQPATLSGAEPRERALQESLRPTEPAAAYQPGEFERFVQTQAGSDVEIRRLGAELVTSVADARGAELSPVVPQEYVVAPGDEVLVTLWGSVDADLRLLVDRAGRITIPRVGTVQVAGLRHAELADAVNRRVAQVFRSFQSSVSLGQLRGIRVFVTGYAMRPGSYTVTSLSTVVGALMRAGGPAAAGSFRNIELRRGRDRVARFDLYQLLLSGDRSADTVLRAGDVVHVNAVETQVAVIGSVNKPAVLELLPGETVADALRMVGGFSAVADRSRVAIERLQERNAGRVAELRLPAEASSRLADGDLLRAFSAVVVALPSERQAKRVRVEGEVLRPGDYVLPQASSTRDAIRAAGGYTAGAFVYATDLSRPSVQRLQQDSYERAVRDIETDLARSASAQRVSSADDSSAQAARAAANARLIERLRALRPTGRVVLQLAIDATDIPDLALEDGDRIYVPPRPTTVGVFGSVFNGATYLYTSGRTLDDYLRLAGGPTKGADEGSSFLVRANGSVESTRQSGSWFNRSGNLLAVQAQPGDTLFVPEEMDKTTFVQAAKDWTQILYQFGLGIAGIMAATR